MTFAQTEIGFAPGLFANRSRRASKARWVDGDFVRFRDGVPAQMGGWVAADVDGGPIEGKARDMFAWQPNTLFASYAALGTHSHVYRYDGSMLIDITPTTIVEGYESATIGMGYSVGPFGGGAYGTPRTSGGIPLKATTWTFDAFGEILLGCFTGDGSIYEHSPYDADPMTLVANAPKAAAICVSDERHVFAFGCDGNPNLVRWSDRENRSDWSPRSSNRAGSYDMQATSPFQCGRRVAGSVLAWTQTELFEFAPLSNALVYSQRRIGSNCGALGPHAVAVLNDARGGLAYWMGRDNFFVFDGIVRPLPCELWDYVYRDINLDQRVKCVARTNVEFGEVWFFYPSAGSAEVDRAVVFSYETGTWTKGTLPRLAWLDAGIFPKPLGVDAAGVIFQHEVGDDAAGDPIPSFVLSHPLTIGVGERLTELSAFWPDLEPGSGGCDLTVIARDYPGGPPMSFGPYPFDSSVEKIDLSIAAREVQLRIAGVSGRWELGAPLLTIQGGGLR
ncbi:hypothetical protein [Sphingomonas baiyangensis]|uniref:Uncharacterized protein n=1 Tax=Sphingomonas baiyangensis TaxID=2572576 RepID=A0A4V5PW74_9SPHN|nr:hypothetical protein [Sphingomonas baiyangensis]TKD50578.1 hypothetical protein FBR43_07215 [Sphingomonas baiyangensis]